MSEPAATIFSITLTGLFLASAGSVLVTRCRNVLLRLAAAAIILAGTFLLLLAGLAAWGPTLD